ncbi:tetraacyldisaccharide 4'-kinase [Plebeiibacterium sediminum]|uniref:Tetraacyldisaccharide 4'-kinase n=1 Tax=Plebeiibacterium sediminum TaxID=2992112 RepID=A0AAE3M218_9BACT|nr:tetraacyldisaccharide 4'-kinase [Plebeiobacterium sediminum]MCW3785511.1 tetraacyldisaccharide 4'-kinase [Plebeiobacterium sediminum]
MKILKYIRLTLFPISVLYGIIIRIRNFLFDIGKLPSKKYPLPLISVGNITVGGTGKTPLTEFLIKSLIENYKLALLSRGYKRKTTGVIISDDKSTALDIGDEPFQIKSKFPQLLVTVAEKRVEGIDAMLELNNKPEVIILDDAYQHRYVKPGLSILVTDYNRPLWKDLMLPAGELREPISGKKRANIILVNKCPEKLSIAEQCNIIKRLNIDTDQSVYFSTIGYQNCISLFCKNKVLTDLDLKEQNILLVTGIANPKPLLQYVNAFSNNVDLIQFADHYQFKEVDLQKIEKRFNNLNGKQKIILTTEKDAVRLREILKVTDSISEFIWYIPIEIKLLNNQQEEFLDKIVKYVKQNK